MSHRSDRLATARERTPSGSNSKWEVAKLGSYINDETLLFASFEITSACMLAMLSLPLSVDVPISQYTLAIYFRREGTPYIPSIVRSNQIK